MKTKNRITLFLSSFILFFTVSSCGHPDSTISYCEPTDRWQIDAKNNGQYFECGHVDLYKKTSLGWEEVVYCVLWAKENHFGSMEYYVAVDNSSMYYSDWVMAHLTHSSEYKQYEVYYRGQDLYCWGFLPDSSR